MGHDTIATKSVFSFFLLLLCLNAALMAQQQTLLPDYKYQVVLQDGTRHIGYVISDDAREIVLKTDTLGEIVIPKYLVKSITLYVATEKTSNEEMFATRYFFTTNGLPIEKGDSYIQWTLFGPDTHFGISNDISFGVLTSWIGIPVIASIKKSHQVDGDYSFALGSLFGTNIWNPGTFFMALPYASVTRGNAGRNISFSAGFGYVSLENEQQSQFLFSIGGLRTYSRTGTFVFDSMILPFEEEFLVILIPGFRFQTRENTAWQFGLPGIYVSGESNPVGFPMVSWFRKL